MIAPLPSLPTIVSISRSPNRLPSASFGRSWYSHAPDIPYFRCVVRAAVSGEFLASVSPDVSIYEFVGDVLVAAFHVGRNLFG